MCHPIETARVHNGAAHRRAVAVHVLGGGVRHDVRSPLDGTAVNGRGERVVDDQGHAVGMGRRSETLDIENGERRVGDCLAEHALSVRSKRRLKLLLGSVGGYEGALDAHAVHGVGEQVVAAAVNRGARHHMVTVTRDVEHGEEVRRLAGAREHSRGTALELGDLRCHVIVRGVLQTRVEVAGFLEVEEAPHVLRGIVLPRRGLIDGNLTRLGIAGMIAALHTRCSDMLCHCGLLCSIARRLHRAVNCNTGKMVYRTIAFERMNHGNQQRRNVP